jgi:hypothetical protein
MTLAERDYLRFAVGREAIMRLVRAALSVGQRLIDRYKRPAPKFVYVATREPVTQAYLTHTISPE